jgi:hypothetical protein
MTRLRFETNSPNYNTATHKPNSWVNMIKSVFAMEWKYSYLNLTCQKWELLVSNLVQNLPLGGGGGYCDRLARLTTSLSSVTGLSRTGLANLIHLEGQIQFIENNQGPDTAFLSEEW